MNKEFGLEINRPFYMVSKMWMSRVATLAGMDIKLQTLSRTNLAQQFFFDGASKTIKNKQRSNLSLEIQNSGTGTNLRMSTTTARWFQLFYFRDNKLVNEKGKVMEVYQGIDRENNNIVIGNSKDGSLN